MKLPTTRLEIAAQKEGEKLIFGIDEAGRGCLAGPVVAAVAAFDWGNDVRKMRRALRPLVRDSKMLSREARQEAFGLITSFATHWGVGVVDAARIDEINILQATFQAMREALVMAKGEAGLLLVDGNMRIPQLTNMQQAIIDGDAKVFSIAAASIIAKEHRDRLLEKLHVQYPVYNFAKHKGYGTAEHRQAISLHGFSPVHRRTFKVKVL